MTQNEPLPKVINDLPPARQRHIRRQPRAASLAERQILLESLIVLTSPGLVFFLFSLLSATVLGLALFLNEPALVIIGIILSPFPGPIYGLSLIPIHLKFNPGINAFISVAVHLILFFVAGMLAGWQQKTGVINHLGLTRFGTLYWLDLVILGVSTCLATVTIVRKGEPPKLIGVLLSYEILCPLALSGYALSLGLANFWPGALIVSLTHLSIAIVLAFLSFLVLSFTPKKVLGWLLVPVPLILIVFLSVTGVNIYKGWVGSNTPLLSPTPLVPSVTNTKDIRPVSSPTTNETPLLAFTPTTNPTRTQTPKPTLTYTLTSTPSPTSFFGLIEIPSGVVIREQPDFQAEIIDYANDGEIIEILDEEISENGSRWYQVSARENQIGWILAELVTLPTNQPTTTP